MFALDREVTIVCSTPLASSIAMTSFLVGFFLTLVSFAFFISSSFKIWYYYKGFSKRGQEKYKEKIKKNMKKFVDKRKNF
jgi:hypothetical protein